MMRQHHQLNGHESEQAPEDTERQRSLAWCGPWDLKELDMTWGLNNNRNKEEMTLFSVKEDRNFNIC